MTDALHTGAWWEAAAVKLRQTARQFALDIIAPLSAQPSSQQTWAGPALRLACKQGLAGIEVSKEYGGLVQHPANGFNNYRAADIGAGA